VRYLLAPTVAVREAGRVIIRASTDDDWAAIWPFLRAIVRGGETYSYDRDLTEQAARDLWVTPRPGRTVVATDDDGTVLGTAKSGPNHGGGASHVATASFMVDPAHAGRGVGRALGGHVLAQARADGFRAMQFNAVVESNVITSRPSERHSVTAAVLDCGGAAHQHGSGHLASHR